MAPLGGKFETMDNLLLEKFWQKMTCFEKDFQLRRVAASCSSLNGEKRLLIKYKRFIRDIIWLGSKENKGTQMFLIGRFSKTVFSSVLVNFQTVVQQNVFRWNVAAPIVVSRTIWFCRLLISFCIVWIQMYHKGAEALKNKHGSSLCLAHRHNFVGLCLAF